MKRKWTRNEVDEEIEVPDNDASGKENSYLENINNRLYFYSEIERNKVLQLNKSIIQLNNELPIQKLSYALEEEIKIYININSYGGSVFAGLSAMDEIINSKTPIYTIVDGCCASAATFLSVVGDKRFIKKHSYMLIHQLSSSFWGKHSQFLDELENQKKLMDVIKNVYKKYTKIPMKEIDEKLKHDLWFDAQTCLKYGLVDEII